MLLCALLRHQGIPARARCGFSAYFAPVFRGDHWVAEYWRADHRRWTLVDAELDQVLLAAHRIAFDPCDVPRDQWVSAGTAWHWCRTGQDDPARFGLDPRITGLGYIRAQLVRDLAALNKVEVGPWDTWGLGAAGNEELATDDAALLDRVATATGDGDAAFAELRTLYSEDARLTIPSHLFHEAIWVG